MCLDTYIHIFEGLLQGGWENLQTSFSSGQHVTPAANSGTRNLMTKSTTPMTLCSLQNNEVHIQFSNSVHSNYWNTLCLSPDIMIWNWSYGAAEVTRRGHWKSIWLICQQTNDKWPADKWKVHTDNTLILHIYIYILIQLKTKIQGHKAVDKY